MVRLSRDDYYMEVARTVSLRGTCHRGRAGAVITKFGRIISTGYVGAPHKLPHCDEVGHELIIRHDMFEVDGGLDPNVKYTPEELMGPNKGHCIRTVHAELNAILQAAKFGVSIGGSEIYCTMFPCYECAKAIVNVEIWKVVADYRYQDMKKSVTLFDEAGIVHSVLHDKELEY